MSDWRTKTMSRIRKLIKQADPKIIEEVKYKSPSNPTGVFVWYREGMISTGETYKKHLRLSFAKGPSLKRKDTKGLINSYRAILIHEGDKINETAFKKLIRDAVALNLEKKNSSKKSESSNEFPKLGAPAERALATVGIKSLRQLAKHTEAKIAGLHGMGPKAIGLLKKELKSHNLSFKKT
jgi:hypothetical protein